MALAMSDYIDDEMYMGEPKTLKANTLVAVAECIKSGRCKDVFVMVGAGMSVSAGIPDFRSPGTGLYANLASLGLPYPEAVFQLSFFRDNPKPFYTFAKDFDPTKFRPTVAHSFLTLLHKKGLLRTCFTQNIDGLEQRAHLPADVLVEAHGTIAGQHCVECHQEADADKMWESIRAGEVFYCEECKTHPVKPDIVFFGEALPARFMHKLTEMREADLLLILGTSLTVQPFASLADLVPPGCPRVLFNREEAGDIGERSDDVLALGDCDAGVRELSRMLGWEEELDAEWATTALPGDEDELKAPVPKGEEAAKDHVEQLAAEIATSLKIDDAHDTEAKVSAVGLPADSGTAPEKPVASRSPSAPEEADVSKTKVTHEPKL